MKSQWQACQLCRPEYGELCYTDSSAQGIECDDPSVGTFQPQSADLFADLPKLRATHQECLRRRHRECPAAQDADAIVAEKVPRLSGSPTTTANWPCEKGTTPCFRLYVIPTTAPTQSTLLIFINVSTQCVCHTPTGPFPASTVLNFVDCCKRYHLTSLKKSFHDSPFRSFCWHDTDSTVRNLAPCIDEPTVAQHHVGYGSSLVRGQLSPTLTVQST